MADETELTDAEFYQYDSTDDTENDEWSSSPSLARRIVVNAGGALLAMATGYLLGWGLSIVLDRWGQS